ncbi:hypothetical protein GWI33_007045 [Rhynchophorus ferrugineus]|uniref:Uncharacterized protein n=1 Tax=Rhynchophorus ferrugineus TaxID=354439 RepID=A0A834MF15_RHYFE|nr:hypothetical protein GWI33_007045 [Rhynchophorus ferrugineus]
MPPMLVFSRKRMNPWLMLNAPSGVWGVCIVRAQTGRLTRNFLLNSPAGSSSWSDPAQGTSKFILMSPKQLYLPKNKTNNKEVIIQKKNEAEDPKKKRTESRELKKKTTIPKYRSSATAKIKGKNVRKYAKGITSEEKK